ncbi:hypothetical protein HZA87_01850, partial [Candidatus Uhrbacteria bacterium]|nr:hypothetical protein [Candidatus Uhrbacteria bacterium]
AMAGYLFSNTKLREELSKSKNAEQAGKILAKHLKHDGEKIGEETMKFVKSDMVQDNLSKAKKLASEYAVKMKKDMTSFVKQEKKAIGSAKQKVMKKVATKVKMKVRKLS